MLMKCQYFFRTLALFDKSVNNYEILHLSTRKRVTVTLQSQGNAIGCDRKVFQACLTTHAPISLARFFALLSSIVVIPCVSRLL